MTIGIPKGLLYNKYHVFARTFFEELGAEIALSPDTNRAILDSGTQHCVDEACLPVKVFHGHAAALKDKCDVMLVPRFMRMAKGQSICPMFCGLVEMVQGIPALPPLISPPVYALDRNSLRKWAKKAGRFTRSNARQINAAFEHAIEKQQAQQQGINQSDFPIKVALMGHAYNIYDTFINMNLVKKLNRLGIGVITQECIDRRDIETEVSKLFKPPFWHFGREVYGACAYLAKQKEVDGIIYVSAFCCGVDSVVIELVHHEVGDFPMLVLKIDEHTGEAGFDTRVEAFADMLKRRPLVDDYVPSSRQCVSCHQSAV